MSMRRFGGFEGVWLDLRHAERSLRRSPSFSLATLATLVIGIGACTIMFTVVNGILVRPLPFRNPERLVGAWHDMPRINLYHTWQSAPTYFTYRTQARTIESIGIYRESAANVSVPGQSGDPERLTIAGSSATLFDVLGVPALIGHAFSEADDQPRVAPVAVIGEDFWRTRFGGDPAVVGRKLEVNGVLRTVVGVMPHTFRFPSAATALWIPLNIDPANPPAAAFAYGGVARLRPGVSLAAAQRDFAAVLPRAADLYPAFVPGISTRQILEQTKPIPIVDALADDITGSAVRTLWLMAAASLVLLLVACVNVGNLSLVRFDARGRELAVRQALGAGMGRVARSYVAELALLAALATLLALVVARAAIGLLVSRGPAIPRLPEVALDWTAVAFALGIAAFAASACSAIPVLRIRYGALVLDRASRGGTASARDNRVRRLLVSAQIAFALVLLAGSGLVFRSFRRLSAVRPGFEAGHVATFWVSLPSTRYRGDSSVVRFYATVLEGARALPGLTSSGLTSRLPLVTRGFNENPLYTEDAVPNDTRLPPLQLFTMIAGDYFGTMRIPLLAGKTFDAIGVQREGDAIVSSRTAEMFWHDATGRTVVGKRFRVLPTSRWYTVVGVVGDVHDSSLAARPSPTVYFPQATYSDSAQQQAARTMALAVRTRGDPANAAAFVRRIIHQLDPTLPVFDVETMSSTVTESTTRLRFTMTVLGGAAVITLLLGAIGLYGVMSYVVTLRRREFGIRLALGATPRALATRTTSEAVAVTTIGIAVGLGAFALTAGFLRALLFGVVPWDPLTLSAAVGMLLVIALFSSWLPARRAAAVDPAETLRAD